MTQKFGISAGGLRPAIYVGKLSKNGTEFTDKEDHTDDAILSVAQYVTDHFGGALEAEYTSKTTKLTVTVTVTSEPV